MRSKVALLITAAVVFAPGWGEGKVASPSPTPSDLAGRILAPTFDEASADSQAKRASDKRFDRVKDRALLHEVVAWGSPVAATQPPSQLLLAIIAALALIASRQLSSFGAQRAPPRLLTV